jgi:hypothetical protein
MDEDRLSPRLGRLIDEAKNAARLLGLMAPEVEGVALLTGSGTVHSGAVAGAPGEAGSAAQAALDRARSAGDEKILAAAVAAPFDPADTVLPSAQSHRCLTGIDPELPLVIKQHGRWVMVQASKVAGNC